MATSSANSCVYPMAGGTREIGMRTARDWTLVSWPRNQLAVLVASLHPSGPVGGVCTEAPVRMPAPSRVGTCAAPWEAASREAPACCCSAATERVLLGEYLRRLNLWSHLVTPLLCAGGGTPRRRGSLRLRPRCRAPWGSSCCCPTRRLHDSSPPLPRRVPRHSLPRPVPRPG